MARRGTVKGAGLLANQIKRSEINEKLLRFRQAKDQLNKRAIRRLAKNVDMIFLFKRQAIL